jgi:hypothetical protein
MTSFRVGQLVKVKRDQSGTLMNPNNHNYAGETIYRIHQIDDDNTCKLQNPQNNSIGNWIQISCITLTESPDWHIVKAAISPEELSILELTEFPFTCSLQTETKAEVVMHQKDALMLLLAAAEQVKEKNAPDIGASLDTSILDSFLDDLN